MTDFNQRLKDIINHEGISVRAFENSLGASPGVIQKAINLGTDIQAKWLLVIASVYSKYSAEWLLRGEGEMFCKDLPSPLSKPERCDNVNCDLIRAKNLEIDALRNQVAYYESNSK